MTEMLHSERSEEEIKEVIEKKSKLTAVRRMGTTQDVANAALFLASDELGFITGQLIVVDSGRSDYLYHGV